MNVRFRGEKMRRGWRCTLAAALCVGAWQAGLPLAMAADQAPSKDEPQTSVELRWWNPAVRGSVGGDGYISERNNEHKLDFEQDLGTDQMNAPEVRLTHGKWSLDYIRFGSSVKGYDLPAPIHHNDKKYKGDLDTDIDIDYAAVDYRHVMEKSSRAECYWTAGARYVRVSATSTGLNSRDERESDSDSASGILPSVGLGGSWQAKNAPKWRGSLSLSGMPLGGHGHLLDLEAGASYQPAKNWQISAGYRLLDMKLRKDDKEVNFQANGPFAEVSYSF